jgi:hypothetical protein
MAWTCWKQWPSRVTRSAQLSERIEPRRVVRLFVVPLQLFTDHQLRPPSTRPLAGPPCSCLSLSRSPQSHRSLPASSQAKAQPPQSECRRVEVAGSPLRCFPDLDSNRGLEPLGALARYCDMGKKQASEKEPKEMPSRTDQARQVAEGIRERLARNCKKHCKPLN